MDVTLSFADISRTYEAFLYGIVIWDWLTSVTAEYRHIWQARWSVSKCQYIVARYICLLLTGALFTLHFLPFRPVQCNALVRLNCIALTIIQMTSMSVLTLRAYMVSGRRKIVLGILLPPIIAMPAIGIMHAVLAVSTAPIEGADLSDQYCQLLVKHRWHGLTAVFLGLPIIAHSVATGIVVRYASKDLPRGTPLRKLLLVDGLLFLVAVNGIGLLEFFFFLLTAVPGLGMLNQAALLSLTSVLCCRLILHIREQSSEIRSGLSSPADWTNSFGKPILHPYPSGSSASTYTPSHSHSLSLPLPGGGSSPYKIRNSTRPGPERSPSRLSVPLRKDSSRAHARKQDTGTMTILESATPFNEESPSFAIDGQTQTIRPSLGRSLTEEDWGRDIDGRALDFITVHEAVVIKIDEPTQEDRDWEREHPPASFEKLYSVSEK